MRYSHPRSSRSSSWSSNRPCRLAERWSSIRIPRSTFYDWYRRYQDGGIEAPEDGKPRPQQVWNKIPDEIITAIVNLALEEPDRSPRELHGHEGQLCVGSQRLSALEGSWPDHQHSLHLVEGGCFPDICGKVRFSRSGRI